MQNSEIGASDEISYDDQETLLDGFVIDIRNFFASTQYISNAVSVLWVKFNRIGSDGRYVDQVRTHVRFLAGTSGSTGIIRGTSTVGVPTFLSACATTTTVRQRGPGSKGRLYLPQCTAPVESNGRYAETTTGALASQVANFLELLGNEEGTDVTAIAPAVVSNVGSPGPMERITGVRVGNVPDVQRRRKNAMVEAYISVGVNTA